MRLARRRSALLVIASSIAGGVAAFGCSLGLDPSLIGQQDEAGADAPGAPQDSAASPEGDVKAAPPSDAKGPTDASISVDGGGCSSDADCAAAADAGGGCVTSAKCDTASHLCVLDVCGAASACHAQVCLPSQTCSQPVSYGFAPASFPVTFGGVGSGGPQYSIAAAWPFVFVATNNGLAAFDVVDPTNPNPPAVTVHGVPFIPLAVEAVGRRVYFITGPEGGGPSFGEAVAWVDVPSNPLLTSLTATAAWVSTTGTNLQGVFASAPESLFLVYGTTALEPTAIAGAPLVDGTSLVPYPNAGLPMGAGVRAATGSRLLTYRYDSTKQIPNFAFVDGAGTATAVTSAEQALSLYGPLEDQAYLTTGDDGSVLFATAVLDLLEAGGNDGIASARLTWLVDSAAAGNIDGTAHVDIASYSPPASGAVVGPPAWIDANTALGFAAPSTLTTNSTSVQIVHKSPASTTFGTTLTVGPTAIGVASSNGFAYALEQTDPKNQTATVQILAPSCGGDE